MNELQKVIDTFKLNVLAVENVPESFSSTVYKVKLSDQQLVYIKIQYTKVKRDREVTVLKRLHNELPVPKLLDYWEGDDDITGALLLSAIDGVPLSEKVDPALAYDIGVHHAKLHAIVPEKLDFESAVSNEYDDWSQFIERQFYSFAEDVKEVIDHRLYERSLHHFHQLQHSLPPKDGPSFIHMDFRPGNILVYENRVAGIIDFESVRIGSTEIDFTKINRDIFSVFPGTLEAFQEGYRTVRPLIDLEKVLPFYAFVDAFNSIGWCKRRGIERNRSFMERNYGLLRGFLHKT
ncbi:phosphotransferase family protein [Alkalihalobacillus sp. CinArs1]|uniref:phosphotransferase family protein n=1 Tax=Alkalihalobacillus sp. CinArs1 TaxID=2995314 RepID=UPI0022DD2C40|nr:aminoglycoside phosphotransferase family protein [Alkalihalobacillus sp. CinArs1]